MAISKYLIHIKVIVDSLIAAGDAISEREHVDVILEDLPKEFNSFVLMIYERLDATFDDDIEALLLVQEAQFEKFCQELTTLGLFANIAKNQTHNTAHNLAPTNHGYP
jgi:hypothetical protein